MKLSNSSPTHTSAQKCLNLLLVNLMFFIDHTLFCQYFVGLSHLAISSIYFITHYLICDVHLITHIVRLSVATAKST